MRILKEECCGLVIDIQERLLPHIHNSDIVLQNTQTLVKGLQALNVPLIVTEQYTKGLGFTVPQIKSLFETSTPVEKIAFSCCDEPLFDASLKELGKKYVIITGIETHVCVLQTAMDLLNKAYIPVIVDDCVSSRKPNDKAIALQRMQASGAIITTYESILFELCRFAGSDTFKAISKLVK